MVSERSRKARQRLLKKYRFGAASSNPGEVDYIELSSPEDVVVGNPFPLTIQIHPTESLTAQVTRNTGTVYAPLSRDLTYCVKQPDGTFLCHQTGTFSFQKGVFIPYNGVVELHHGWGRIFITEYTLEAFSLKVSVGGAEAIWPMDSEHVWCYVNASEGTQGESTPCPPGGGTWDNDEPHVALPYPGEGEQAHRDWCGKEVVLRRTLESGEPVVGNIKDRGPMWFNNPYWADHGWPPNSVAVARNVVEPHKHEVLKDGTIRHSPIEGEGMDLSSWLFRQLDYDPSQIPSQGYPVYWRF